MPDDVGQALLDDPVGSQVDRSRKRDRRSLDLETCVQADPLRPLDQVLDLGQARDRRERRRQVSRLPQDVAPARKLGMKTGLFAGDKTSLQASAEQLKDPASRPDVMLTELSQIADVVG